MPVEIVERERAFAFRRAQLHARHEPAEIAIPSGDSTSTGRREAASVRRAAREARGRGRDAGASAEAEA